MRRLIQRLARRRDEEGQGLAEYSLILLLVALASVGTLTVLGNAINASSAWSLFDNVP